MLFWGCCFFKEIVFFWLLNFIVIEINFFNLLFFIKKIEIFDGYRVSISEIFYRISSIRSVDIQIFLGVLDAGIFIINVDDTSLGSRLYSCSFVIFIIFGYMDFLRFFSGVDSGYEKVEKGIYFFFFLKLYCKWDKYKIQMNGM